MSITLKSNDGQTVSIDSAACERSKYLKTQIDSGKNEIVLDDIKGEVLNLVA